MRCALIVASDKRLIINPQHVLYAKLCFIGEDACVQCFMSNGDELRATFADESTALTWLHQLSARMK